MRETGIGDDMAVGRFRFIWELKYTRRRTIDGKKTTIGQRKCQRGEGLGPKKVPEGREGTLAEKEVGGTGVKDNRYQ
jgi:hypothetical protein